MKSGSLFKRGKSFELSQFYEKDALNLWSVRKLMLTWHKWSAHVQLKLVLGFSRAQWDIGEQMQNCQWYVTSAGVLSEIVGDEWKWKFWGRSCVPSYMFINMESSEMDWLYKGEIVLCYIFLDVLPLIIQEIEEKKDFFTKQRLQAFILSQF